MNDDCGLLAKKFFAIIATQSHSRYFNAKYINEKEERRSGFSYYYALN